MNVLEKRRPTIRSSVEETKKRPPTTLGFPLLIEKKARIMTI